HLPRHLRFLQALGVRICHYKVCSTFDSAPRIGSIGSALEIGRAIYGGRTVPIIVGAPDLGRYQVFGNLFARAGGEIFRIDRHPT
ncbi:four-carbon acid sugar kinase family protein, partial [Klebsiella pneumoniae]|nr:four-carbon acid sugar kinase family protein [Klebsiella pneumoniae]